MTITINGTTGISGVDGTASTPAVQGNDTNTGMFFPAADTIAFAEGGTEVMRIDSSGNVGIGTSSPLQKLDVVGTGSFDGVVRVRSTSTNTPAAVLGVDAISSAAGYVGTLNNLPFQIRTNDTERMRIDSSGNLLVGKTTTDDTVTGVSLEPSQFEAFNFTQGDGTGSGWVIMCNRQGSDGSLITFRQANTTEGNITVSGTTVSYNGGHLARWSQLPDGSKDDALLKGTVLTNLDEMCVWIKDGEQLPNEQLNKMKVSDVEGDTNVAGVFVNWTRDEDCNTDDMNVAMTGDMIIRIAQGVVVQKGDLLMSAGDGTAKPQGDDIVRSKTIAKVISTHITCTYEDGSYCVPCVLMAC